MLRVVLAVRSDTPIMPVVIPACAAFVYSLSQAILIPAVSLKMRV
jgi:hypothetical protein